ncbi:MAG: zinc-dependent metalloprotease [Bacteroidetes bacterium]|nr:zinc-dependent metalloprotease [Bacteroidota bacterium]
MKRVSITLLLSLTIAAAFAQKRPVVTSWDDVRKFVENDTTTPATRPRIKSYESVITKDFTTQTGLFTVHRAHDTVYFEIPDSLLNRDIMVINRLGKGPGGTGQYAGEELDEKTIFFEKGPDSSIFIRYDLVISEADSGNAIYKAVVSSNLNPMVATFPVLTYGKDKKSYVIDVSRFLKEKNFINSIKGNSALGKSVNTGVMKDFYIGYIHTYPINVEIDITKNMESKAATGSSPEPTTVETHTSFIALPKIPMQRRYFDPRVGYFADYYFAYGDKQQHTDKREFILRWRLEPKDEDIQRYKKGELVEPKNPIVIYIDPSAPKQWRPYLIQGINDWQKAFETAGFKNAIIGREWPENDTTMHTDDARYSMLNYFPSEIENAYGPNVHDPRSGEIVQTHIGWYHNVMSLLHNWYMIQAAAIDPRARKARFDDELMGQLIRFVSSHEVGHTLGLRHNFGSSSQTPVDSLRSRSWLRTHGHTASIMDYARFNYVAQPEDHLTPDEIFPHIGEYDRWAIEWGYKSSFAPNAEEDKKIAGKWIVDNTSQNPRLWFGDGETRKFDPRCQTEDLGDDAAKASAYGINNLKRILPHLREWTREDGDLGENLTTAYKTLSDQYFRYMGHVLKYVAGVYYDIHTDYQPGPAVRPVPKARQIEALSFFDTQLFTTPLWLMDSSIVNRIALPTEPNIVEDVQVRVLNSLLDVSRLNKLLADQKQFGSRESLSPVTYMTILHHDIWRELKTNTPVIDDYRRNLQKSYWASIVALASGHDEVSLETDVSSLVKADIYQLRQDIDQAIPRTRDQMTLLHLKDLQFRIKDLVEHHNN